MAILAECSNCERKGGYAYSADDTVCARCMNESSPRQTTHVKFKKKDEEGQE